MRLPAVRNRPVHAVRSYFRRAWGLEDLITLPEISLVVRQHLDDVYLLLCYSFAVSALGCYLQSISKVGVLFTVLGLMGSSLRFVFISPLKEERIYLFVAIAFFGGALIVPLIDLFLFVEPGCVITALLGAAIVFIYFWVACLKEQDMAVIYTIALFASAVVVLPWLHIVAPIFFICSDTCKFQLQAGLGWFMLYVVVYSQELVIQAQLGDLDTAKHALILFTHVPAYHVHLVHLMVRKVFKRD